MKFVVNKSNSTPPQVQLLDQIRFAIGIGRLRPGDALPSVRELEQELEISKNTIWRVYQQLEKTGLLTLRQGQGARVNTDHVSGSDEEKLKQCERLCQKTLDHVLRSGIHPASFARYLQQYVARSVAEAPPVIFAECNDTETEIFSRQIAELWGVDIQGISIDELPTALSQKRARRNSTVLTNIYHVDEVREILKGTGIEVLGLQFRWDQRMLRAISDLKAPAKVLFVFKDGDEHLYGNLVREEFKALTGGRGISISLKGISELGNIRRFCLARKYDFIFFSNRLWHSIPTELKKLPFVARPTLQLDPAVLERVRTEIGAI